MDRRIAPATALVLLSIFLFPVAAQAAPITTLFSTGVSPAGLALGDLAADPHYVLTASPGGAFPVASGITVAAAAMPAGWTANTATSRWINPTGLGALPADWHPGGVYIYATTFSLFGFDPTTTTISLGWAADDNDLGAAPPPYDFIAVNGFPVAGSGTGSSPGSYAGLHPKLLGPALPWLPGINTLEFVFANTDSAPGPGLSGPTGLHVHIISADAALVPEPASLLLLAGGLAAMITIAWRRRR
jgi:PEP-CTERM motif